MKSSALYTDGINSSLNTIRIHRVLLILLFIQFQSCVVFERYWDYPKYKVKTWIINDKPNTNDTIYVQNYALVHFYQDRLNDSNKFHLQYDTKVYEDSILGIIKNSLLLDTNHIFLFLDSSKNKKDFLPIRNSFFKTINVKRIDSSVINQVKGLSKLDGYLLVPIIDISYNENYKFCEVIITICIVDNKDKIVFKKSMGRIMGIPNEKFYYSHFNDKERYERNKLPLKLWQKTVLEIMSDFQE